jgi:signal transduction histidine kinase
VAVYLHLERQALTQYDLDILPRFERLRAVERVWFETLKMDVYVPIHAMSEWVGLLALGPKKSQKPYFDHDLAILGTLADQTSVALENARLVEDLYRLNEDLQAAYNDLDRANQQLKELDNLKSGFIGVITHELRSPFINIDFSLQLIERHGLDCFAPEQREQFEQLKANTQATKQMIDNLVNFATFLSKQGELRLSELDPCQVIEEAILPNQPHVTNKELTLTIEVSPDLPSVLGDQQRLTDAVYQLLNNAIKFTAPGGQIWIRCRPLPSRLRFEVQDTGRGVPSEKLPVLWEGFAQMSDSLLRGVEGLGLGLTLVKYVANAHHGDVFATSEVGVGSVFGFEVPLNGQSVTTAPKPGDKR